MAVEKHPFFAVDTPIARLYHPRASNAPNRVAGGISHLLPKPRKTP